MLYREITADRSEIHTKHINTLCGQNVALLNVKPGGTYSNQRALYSIAQTLTASCYIKLSASYSGGRA
jgi:hypothetical protein